MTSKAFDFEGDLPPTVKHVGPRLDDPLWAEPWLPPPGDDPLVLVGLSWASRTRGTSPNGSWPHLGELPVRAESSRPPRASTPRTFLAPPRVQVVRSAPHAQVLREAGPRS